MANIRGRSDALVLLTLLMMGFVGAAAPSVARTSAPNLIPAGFTSRFVATPKVRFHVVIGGHGTPLVLLHGWPATWYEWHAVMPALAQRYTVIVPDLPGLGDSSVPTCCYDKLSTANLVHALVAQLGYGRIDLAGHDIGGMVAYAYAAAYPHDVAKLAILDVPIPSPIFYQFPVITATGPASAWHFGFNSVADVPEALVHGRERIYLDYFYVHLAANPQAITPQEVDEYVRHYAVPASLHAGFNYYRAFPQDIAQNARFATTKLTMPVLGLGGDASGGTAIPYQQLRGLALHVSGGAVPHSGHWVPEEQPGYVVQQFRAFFG